MSKHLSKDMVKLVDSYRGRGFLSEGETESLLAGIEVLIRDAIALETARDTLYHLSQQQPVVNVYYDQKDPVDSSYPQR